MAALGTFYLATLPDPLVLTSLAATAPAIAANWTVTIAPPLPTPLVVTTYGIGGTSATGTVTIPTTGQLFPPLYNK